MDEVARLRASAPPGWSVVDEPKTAEVVVLGPTGSHGVQARVEVRSETQPAEPIEAISRATVKQLRSERPDTLVAGCDVWPHPLWGPGRLLQTARLDDGLAMAHDRYVFVDGQRVISITLDCALAELLRVEDEVAAIVASVQPMAVAC